MNINKDYMRVMRYGCKMDKLLRYRGQLESGYRLFVCLVMGLCLVMLALIVPACADIVDMDIIAQIESGGHALAYNRHSRARGLYQITPVCLEDYNNYHDKRYNIDDMFDAVKNTQVANWYIIKRIPQLLKYYRHEVILDNVLTAYNCGVGCVSRDKLPGETIAYINKYKKLVKGKELVKIMYEGLEDE